MENARTGKDTAEELFSMFMEATDCPEITHTFGRLVQVLRIQSDGPRDFYNLLKGKLQSWKCKSLWELLDCRANQKEYGKGKICEDTHVLIIGAGPIGLRTAIEVALLGAHVVIVEKRESFTRNNVLHLWPFLLTDFRSLGAKKFYGKFCSGSIDHISIRRLQSILLKTALILGAKLYTGVTFEHVIEPNSPDDCWKCKVSPESHPVSEHEFDVLIAADGKKNILPGFQQIEMRGTLAIGITANFVNHGSEAEANVEEISGIAYQFNPQFFDDLYERKGIKLENIVYYKDETHYFVMTAGKASLLKRGALKQDLTPSARLLAPDNVDHSKLLEYVTDVVKYATKGTLNHLELKLLANNQPDIAAFDFTSIKKAEHAARIVERKGSKLLVGLVGDSLLEPFWPTGSGCARGVLSALDAAWMIRSFAQERPPLQILSERENIYRLLSGTNSENLQKTFANYTINPSTRYLHITNKRIREVYHLYDTDDPVNADFSIGSPQTAISKASRKRRISTGAKHSAARGHRRGRASSHLAVEHGRIRSTSGSSAETLDTHKPLTATKSEPLDRKGRANTLSSVGSDDEVFKTKTRRGKAKPSASPLTGRRGRSSTVGSSGDELKEKRKKTGRKRTILKDDIESPKEKTQRKRGFFGFGKGKQKRKAEEESDRHLDKQSKSMKWKRGESIEQLENNARNGVALTGVQKRKGSSLRSGEKRDTFGRDDSWARLKPAGSFSREQYTRRSAREIIREMEARAKGENVINVVSGGEAVQQLPKSRTVGDIRTGLGREAKVMEEERNIKNKPNKKQDGKPMINKEHEKKKSKNEERKMKEEEKRRKEEEKKRHEVEKKNMEEHEKRKKKEEEQKKKVHNQRLHNHKETTATPPKKRTRKQQLLDEIAEISPSAKRAMPVLSQLSPALDKETEGIVEHTVTSAVRDAAMILLATPLLIDSLTSTARMDRKGSWLLRDSGRVRDVVKRYDMLSDMKPVQTSANSGVTPLRRPKDRIDGVSEIPRRLEGMVQIEESKMDATMTELNDLNPATEVRKSLVLKQGNDGLSASTSLQRLKEKLQDINDGKTQTLREGEVTVMSAPLEKQDGAVCNDSFSAVSSVDSKTAGQEKTLGNVTSQRQRVVQDFNSPIWQKTAIAVVTEKSRENKENEHDVVDSSGRKGENKDKHLLKVNSSQNRRRSSVLPSETMEEKLENLLNSTTIERAKESINYMISVFRQIQKHPNEERHYKIFKGRVRFRKHVGTIRNAKLFMEASGWTEIGNFFIFPLSKQIEAPLLVLNKYLSILEEKGKCRNTAEEVNQPRLRRAGSSDLAERIMELKDALVSARIIANKNRARKGSADETTQLITFKRTISLDDISTSRRRTSNLAFFTVDDTRRKNGLEKVENGLDKGTKDEARNLRRSASESTLNKSPNICSGPSSNFTPFIRTFSGRSVKEGAGDYDLVMETPLGVTTVSVNDNRDSQGTGIHGDKKSTEYLKLTPQQGEIRAQLVRSPAELVHEEADELSSMLGNLIDSLGSLESTENEEDSEVKKVQARKTQEVGREGRAAAQDKDEELESLCETLNYLINEDTSDSSESSLSRESRLLRKKPGSSKEVGSRSSAFKPPLHSTKKTTQRMENAKSVDKIPASSQRGFRANGDGSQERVVKSRSLNALAANSRSSNGRNRSCQQREVVPRKSMSGSDSKSSQSKKVMRAHRQNASQVLETSRITRNKEIKTNRLDSATKRNERETRRGVSKAKSVDLARDKERLPATKSRSVELSFKSDEANRRKSSTRSQMGRRSASSVSSSDENMKTQRMRNQTQRTSRPQPARQSLSQRRNRLSSEVKSANRRGKPAAVKKKENKLIPSSDTDSKSTEITQSDYIPVEEHASAGSNENCVSLVDRAESAVCNGPAESEQTLQDQSLAERNIEIQSRVDKKCSHSATMNGNNTDFAVKLEEECANIAVMQPSKENEGNKRKDSSCEAGLSADNSTAVVELSKEIHSYYGTNSAQLDGGAARVTDVQRKPEESSKVDRWFPSDAEFRQLVQQTKKYTAASDEENKRDQVAHTSVHETDSGYGENSEDPATEPSRPPSVKLERSDPKVKSKKRLADIGRQHSIDKSRKDVVSLTLDERKQQILDAAVAKPKSKPTDKRRSILQIKSRSDGKLVKSTKETFEKQPSNQAASKSTESKFSKQQLYNRGRKKKSLESANGTLAAVTEDQEEPQKERIRNGAVPPDPSHDSVAGNAGSTGQGRESSTEQSNEGSVKGKRHSPVKLSPFWLRFTKRRGSYDLDHNSVGNTQESPQHFSSNELE